MIMNSAGSSSSFIPPYRVTGVGAETVVAGTGAAGVGAAYPLTGPIPGVWGI